MNWLYHLFHDQFKLGKIWSEICQIFSCGPIEKYTRFKIGNTHNLRRQRCAGFTTYEKVKVKIKSK